MRNIIDKNEKQREQYFEDNFVRNTVFSKIPTGKIWAIAKRV